MKFVTFIRSNKEVAGIVVNNEVFPLNEINPEIPVSMKEMLNQWEEILPLCKEIEKKALNGEYTLGSLLSDVSLKAPIPNPTSCRDGYAFRQHVAAARRNRKVPMIEEFDQYPIFYFTNHNAVQGPGEIPCMPDHFNK
jgi:fumarylacetoacetate (FAA) hydrolase